MPEDDEFKTVRVRVSGVVQGVGFRYYTHRVAVSLGLDGYVRNRSDGSVEAVAEGNAEIVDLFLEHVAKGPPGSSVRGIAVSEIPSVGYDGFDIRI
ncbi:MAG: acylphosphatase [Candidatus Krumholzibacteria bacterium]|nr:acylphosphatase [Candidatus Krumholzibacteria bacterium]